MPCSYTLKQPVTLDGIGLHTGAQVRVELRPACAGSGRLFVRDGVRIPALVDQVVDTRRCVTLGQDGVTVSTVEHLLAALLLAGVDNVEIHVTGPELPALDGCARQWYDAISSAGLYADGGESHKYCLERAGWIVDGDSQFFFCPAETLVLYAAISIPDTVAERMAAGGAVTDPAISAQMLRARTYGLERELQALWQAGLAKGGSLDNAVVLTRDGYLNTQVWPDEPAWHKVLDLAGDLALLGRPLAGMIWAVRAGHAGHVALARHLRSLPEK